MGSAKLVNVNMFNFIKIKLGKKIIFKKEKMRKDHCIFVCKLSSCKKNTTLISLKQSETGYKSTESCYFSFLFHTH